MNLSVLGLASGVTASFSPNPTVGNSLLTLVASSSASIGTTTLTITGTSSKLTATTTLSLVVAVPTFTLSAGSMSLGQGSSATTYICMNPLNGFAGGVSLSASGLPSGVTASFLRNPTTGSSMLTLTASSSAAVGQYNVTITGKSGALTETITFALTIAAPSFTLSARSLSLGQGASRTSYISVNPLNGFTGSVTLSASGLPSSVTASFSPNPTTGYNNTLTLTASSSAAVGQYNVIITSKSGNQTVTTTFPLGILAPNFTLSGGSLSLGQDTSGTTYVNVNPLNGFSGSVTLSASGLPSGVTASFSPNPTAGNSTVTFTATNSASLGQYSVIVTGTSGNQTATTTFAITIGIPTFTLANYISGLSIAQCTSDTTYIYMSPSYGFTGSVTLSASGPPSGVTASFSPNRTTGYSNALTLTASGYAAPGQSTVTVTGTAGNQTASTTFPLTVTASPTSGLQFTPSLLAGSRTRVMPPEPLVGQSLQQTRLVPSISRRALAAFQRRLWPIRST